MITDEDLLSRAIRQLKHLGEFHCGDDDSDPHSLDCSLGGRVSHVFQIGQTSAWELCRRFGEDPEFSESTERAAHRVFEMIVDQLNRGEAGTAATCLKAFALPIQIDVFNELNDTEIRVLEQYGCSDPRS